MIEKPSVLLVDDEEIVLKRLKPSLEKSGYCVETFGDGASAMQRLEEKDFDIIVTDLRMPGLDGMQLLEYVVAGMKKTKVILITGYATIEIAREALVKGAFDFIAKPFKPNDLREVITRAAKELK